MYSHCRCDRTIIRWYHSARFSGKTGTAPGWHKKPAAVGKRCVTVVCEIITKITLQRCIRRKMFVRIYRLIKWCCRRMSSNWHWLIIELITAASGNLNVGRKIISMLRRTRRYRCCSADHSWIRNHSRYYSCRWWNSSGCRCITITIRNFCIRFRFCQFLFKK